MLTLLGSVLGFGTSFLPKVMDYFQDKADKKHELEIMTRQAEINLDRTAIEANIREVEAIHEHDASLDGGGFVNGLRASVRPVITYAFFILFSTVKGVTLYTMVATDGMDLTAGMLAVWDQETQAIFSAIIAFWFGNRAMSKARAYIGRKEL